MKKRIFILFLPFLLVSCVSIPKETVDLSELLGKDLMELHKAHVNALNLYFGNIKNKVNEYVDEVYAPYIIHYVLKKQLDLYRSGDQESIYYILIEAGESDETDVSESALDVMSEFVEDAKDQIEIQRSELLQPIIDNERIVLNKVNQSYQNAFYANSAITGHLKSIRKVKETQNEALSILGIENTDSMTVHLVKVSKWLSEAVDKAKEIDLKSDEAISKIEKVNEQIKTLTTKQN